MFFYHLLHLILFAARSRKQKAKLDTLDREQGYGTLDQKGVKYTHYLILCRVCVEILFLKVLYSVN